MTAEQNTDDNIAEHRTTFTERRTAFSEHEQRSAQNKPTGQNIRSASLRTSDQPTWPNQNEN